MNRRLLLRLAAAAAAICAVPSFAGDILKPKGVVELFTSQGCNSCPPADAVLAELAERGDVVALGYHVDYWDYLGWKDTLGSPENTERQKQYGRSFGKRSVYTPQAVINGRTHVNGAKREAVAGALTELENSGEGLSVDINVTRSGDSVMIDAAAAPGEKGDAHLVLVHFDPMKPVDDRARREQGPDDHLRQPRHQRPDRRHVARQGAALRTAAQRDRQEGRLRGPAAIGEQGRAARADPRRRGRSARSRNALTAVTAEQRKTGASLLPTPVTSGFWDRRTRLPCGSRGWFDPTQTRGRGAWGLRAGAGPNRLRQRG